MSAAARTHRVRRCAAPWCAPSAGVTLDATEAETLLHARGLGDGEPLDRLLTAAGRVRDAGLASAGRPGVVTYSRKVFIPLTHLCRDRCHYCTFVTTPGQLRAQGKAPFLSPDEVLDIARAGRRAGLQGGAVHPRRPPRGPLAGRGRVAARARLRLDAGLPAGDGDPGAGGDRAAAAPQPGRADLGGDPAAQAGLGVDGHDAGDDGDPAVVGARRPALRLARTRSPPSGCGCWRTPAAPPSRSPPACCWASARTTPSGSTRSARSGPRRSGTGTCRRSSSRTSGPSPGRRCRRTTTWSCRSTSPPSR